MTRALASKVTIPLTPVALGSRVDFSWLTSRSLFRCEGLCTRRTLWFDLEELEAGLLGVGRFRLKLGWLVVAVLELSLKLDRVK